MTVQNDLLTLAETKNAVDTMLHEYCDFQRKKAESYDTAYARLWRVIDEYVQAGGKRIRPYLTLLAYQAYGGKDIAAVMPVAAAWELLHACLLVHDDIIDKDTVRHGRPNIAGIYEQIYGEQLGSETKHFAASAALLAGDLLLSGAHQLLLQADISSEQKLQVSDLLSDALFGVGGGELLDIEAVFEDLTTVRPEKIARYKTAEYSFEFPMVCGAVLAGAGVAEQQLLREVGTNIGIVFQLVDDILGVFGNEQATGKSSDTDIYEKKRTLLAQEACKLLEAADAQRLKALYTYGHALSGNEAAEARALIEKSGARAAVEEKVALHVRQAKDAIQKLEVADAYKLTYENLVDTLAKRIA